MTGYDAAHQLGSEYNSAQKVKADINYRRDYSQDNLQKFNRTIDTNQSFTNSKYASTITPYKPKAYTSFGQKRVSYDPAIFDPDEIARKYYDSSKYTYKKGNKENLQIHQTNDFQRKVSEPVRAIQQTPPPKYAWKGEYTYDDTDEVHPAYMRRSGEEKQGGTPEANGFTPIHRGSTCK